MGETNVLFSIGPLEVTGAVVTMWVIVAVLALASWLATRKLRDVPGPLQNAAEMAVEKLQGFYGGIMGPANARRYFPMMATFFIFIVVSNYIGLLPGAGQVFTVPTATLSVTAGLAIIAFCMTHTVGIQRRGLGGYLKSFIKPFLLMLPLNLIEQIVRPFSLALRLYGNLYGEEMVTHELGNLFPLVLPLLMQVLSLLFCLIQAIVFTMLLSIYIEEAIEEECTLASEIVRNNLSDTQETLGGTSYVNRNHCDRRRARHRHQHHRPRHRSGSDRRPRHGRHCAPAGSGRHDPLEHDHRHGSARIADDLRPADRVFADR